MGLLDRADAPRPPLQKGYTMRRLITAIAFVAVLIGVGSTAQAATPPIHAAGFKVVVTAPLNQPLDAGCVAIHNQSSCGNALVTVTLKGFKAYGGIAPCPTAGCTGGMPIDQFGHVGGNGSATLIQLYRCGSTGAVRYMTAKIPALVIWQGVASGVNTSTRVDANTARVQTTYPFPNPHTYSPCPSDTRILIALVDHLSVGYSGGNGVAAATFHNNGYYLASPSAS
jgi:hypothetical protein